MSAGRFATLTFEREVAAPVATLWQAWVAPAARVVWSAPAPGVTVEYSAADARVGGIERSVCRVEGYPDVHVEGRWLELQPGVLTVNSEVVASEGATESAALVTAELSETAGGSRIAVTVQLASLSQDMVAGYQHGFNGGLDNLVQVAERSMVISRVIRAPLAAVWAAWWDAESLPKWWGPDGFSCRTARIDLREGGEWVFDMIG
ncbi:MAG TPA: SRPBCC domain-containing protein, partial [Tabrizicola sp.]|nr:SRPBCC domain-containing protein [Tabrizicola sp.]